MNDNNRPNDVNHNNGSSLPVQEHSSSRGPVSEIDLFKKQLEQGIKEPEEETNEDAIGSSNKTLIIIACVLVGLALFGLGYLIGMNAGLNNKSKCDDYVPVTNDDKDKTEDKKDDNEVKEVDIDSSIKELYEKYHSDEETTHITDSTFEYALYEKDSFKVSNLSYIPTKFANYIAEKGKDEIEKNKKEDDNDQEYLEKSDGETIIKKYFKEIFGDNLKYKASLFESGCHTLLLSDGKFYLGQECGGTASRSATYKLVKAEKDNKYLYLTEEVTFKEPNKDENTYTYKWTLNKDADGNYYFLRSEKQAK